MKLRIRILATDPEERSLLRNYYHSRRVNHATDSGIDLVCPRNVVIHAGETTKIPLGISCEVVDSSRPHGYYLYPRSSIIKTPMRLANSVGIIDFGYRGEITAVVDYHMNQYANISTNEFVIEPGTRYFQLCSPDLSPIEIELATDGEELTATARGEGGFGSTN